MNRAYVILTVGFLIVAATAGADIKMGTGPGTCPRFFQAGG